MARARPYPPPRRAEGGFTIMELMVVLAIIALMMGAVVTSLNALTRADLRSAAFRTAGAIRYTFDRATMTGMYMRLAIDIDKGQVWIEQSDDLVSLRPGRSQFADEHLDESKEERQARLAQQQGLPGGEEGEDLEARIARKKKERDEAKAPSGLPFFGLGESLTDDENADGSEDEGYTDDGSGFEPGIDAEVLIYEWEKDMQPVQRKRPSFTPLKNIVAKTIKLPKGVRVAGVTTPRLTDPIQAGHAYIYFFPQGHSEAAVIHFTDAEEDKYFSVVLHPLTGRARVYGCYYEVPEDFGASDDKRKHTGKDACAKEGAL